jgi:general secretion pathway protein M
VSLRERYTKLDTRERRLLSILLGVFAVSILLLVPIGISSALGSRRDANAELRDLTQKIHESRSQIAEKKARHDALLARYAKPAPPLAGLIEEAAKNHGLAVPEAQDKPEIPHGKKYSERLTVVKMHKVGMLGLVKMLEKIEQSGYPVAISRLNIKPRAGEPDSFEVELGVSAYDRKSDPKESAGPAASASASPAEEEAP